MIYPKQFADIVEPFLDQLDHGAEAGVPERLAKATIVGHDGDHGPSCLIHHGKKYWYLVRGSLCRVRGVHFGLNIYGPDAIRLLGIMRPAHKDTVMEFLDWHAFKMKVAQRQKAREELQAAADALGYRLVKA
jgi:hypothetical protein